MVQPWTSVKFPCRLYNFCARPMLICKSVAPSKKVFMHQSAKRSIVTTIDRIALQPKIERKFPWQNLSQNLGLTWPNLAEILKRLRSYFGLNVAPLAPLVINEYLSGRVFCMDYQIYFQLGGAAGFSALCDKIYSSVCKYGQLPRHFRLDEVRRLKCHEMVLCSGTLNDLLWGSEASSDLIRKLEVPGALYRGRLLQDGDIDATIRGQEGHWTCDQLEVELVDIGVTAYVHVTKLIPMPQAVINMPAMAITIGLSEGDEFVQYEDEALLEGGTAERAFINCNRYVTDAVFMPTRIHPDDEHLPPKSDDVTFADVGTCVRRVDGLLKFEMPNYNVESVPEYVVKLINHNLPFKTKAYGV